LEKHNIGREMHKANYGIYPIKHLELGPITPFNKESSKNLVGPQTDSEINRRVLEMCKNKYESQPMPVNGDMDIRLEFHIREALKILLNDSLFDGDYDSTRLIWQKRVRIFLKNREKTEAWLNTPNESESDTEEYDEGDLTNLENELTKGFHAIITLYDINDPINSEDSPHKHKGDAWLLWDPSWILAQTWRSV
jgi:hypothetical protein